MPKTREQFQQIRDERRDAILETCTYLFSFIHYKAISVDRITEHAKCSHGLFYHYFANKDEAFKATLDAAIDAYSQRLEKINLYNQKAKYALHDLLIEINNVLTDKNDLLVCQLHLLVTLYLEKDSLPKLPPRELKEHQKPLFYTVKKLVEKGIEEKDFINNDPLQTTVAIVAMIKGLTYNRLNLGYKKFVCPSAEIVMNMVKL